MRTERSDCGGRRRGWVPRTVPLDPNAVRRNARWIHSGMSFCSGIPSEDGFRTTSSTCNPIESVDRSYAIPMLVFLPVSTSISFAWRWVDSKDRPNPNQRGKGRSTRTEPRTGIRRVERTCSATTRCSELRSARFGSEGMPLGSKRSSIALRRERRLFVVVVQVRDGRPNARRSNERRFRRAILRRQSRGLRIRIPPGRTRLLWRHR